MTIRLWLVGVWRQMKVLQTFGVGIVEVGIVEVENVGIENVGIENVGIENVGMLMIQV